MIQNLPTYISLTFGLTTIATLLLFFWVIKNSDVGRTGKGAIKIIFSLVVWLIVQAFLTLNKVYNSEINYFPPKILLFGILPAVLAIILLFATRKGRQFVDSLPLKNLIYLNIVRVPVELVLFWLFLNKAVPELMTLEGRNFDIFSGITAPIIAYFGFSKNKISKNLILAWNFRFYDG